VPPVPRQASVLHRAPVVLPIGAEPIRDGGVLVDGQRIGWVGPAARYDGPTVATQDWPGLLLPGLVNAHAHLQYTAYADMYAPDVDFFAWIARFPVRNRDTPEPAWAESARAGVAELLRTGTTCVADITVQRAAIEAVADAGLAGVSYVEVVGADAASWPDHRARLLATLSTADGRRAVGVSPHAPYTLSSQVFGDCVALARERRLRLHPHVAESSYETEFVAAGTGAFAEANRRWGLDMELMRKPGRQSPVGYVDGLAGLGPDVHVAHGVRVSAVDRARLRERGTVVALCARSNATLGCGAPPVAAYRAEGNAVAVGTDSRASVPSLDLLAELGLLREIALGQGSPEAGLDRWLVEAATVGGARAMGLTDVGVLTPGARADLAAFDVPLDGDPYVALVRYGAGRCLGTVVAGRQARQAGAGMGG